MAIYDILCLEECVNAISQYITYNDPLCGLVELLSAVYGSIVIRCYRIKREGYISCIVHSLLSLKSLLYVLPGTLLQIWINVILSMDT